MAKSASDVKAGGAYVEIGGDDNALDAALNKAKKKLQGFADSAQKVGMGLLAGAAAVLSPVILGLRKQASFSEEMAKVSTMLSGADMKFMPEFSKAVKGFSVEFNEGTDTISKGLYDILSASVAPERALEVLRSSLMSAKGGLTTTAISADALTTMLNSFGLKAGQAADVADLLFSIVYRGKTDFATLAGSIGQVATTASSAGLSMEEFGAALATMTRSGVKTDIAVTSLKAILSDFLAPQAAAANVAKKMGLELNTTTLRTIGLKGALEKLQGARPEDIAKIFPNVRALTGLLPLIKNYDAYLTDVGIMTERSGRAAEAFGKQTDNLNFVFQNVKFSLSEMLRSIGEAVEPMARAWVSKVKEVLASAQAWIDANPEIIRSVVNVAIGIAKIGAAALAAGLALKAFLLLFSPTGAIGVALVALAMILDTLGYVDLGFQDLFENVKVGGFRLITWLTALGYELYNSWIEVTTWIAELWANALAEVRGAWAEFTSFWGGQVGERFLRVWFEAVEFFSRAWQEAIAGVYRGIRWLSEKFAGIKFALGILNTEEYAAKMSELEQDRVASEKELQEKLAKIGREYDLKRSASRAAEASARNEEDKKKQQIEADRIAALADLKEDRDAQVAANNAKIQKLFDDEQAVEDARSEKLKAQQRADHLKRVMGLVMGLGTGEGVATVKVPGVEVGAPVAEKGVVSGTFSGMEAARMGGFSLGASTLKATEKVADNTKAIADWTAAVGTELGLSFE